MSVKRRGEADADFSLLGILQHPRPFSGGNVFTARPSAICSTAEAPKSAVNMSKPKTMIKQSKKKRKEQVNPADATKRRP